MEKISFVIPCYYSEKSIGMVVDRIIKTVESDKRFDYEIICVNDGSVDGTYAVLRTYAEKNKKIKVVDLSRNFGQHSALMAGFNFVTGDYVVCLDDDGQNPPEEMFLLIDKLIDEDYDLVSAKYEDDNRSFIRRVGSRVSFAMSKRMIGMPDGIELNSYYVMKRFVVNEIVKYKNSYPFVHGLALRVTRNIANVTITHDERINGSSGYNFKSLFKLWMNGFTAFSEKPLRVTSYVGVSVAAIGFIYALVIIILKCVGIIDAVGYASIMAVLLILGGLIMLFLGMIGEYIGRMYISINDAPQYAIRQTKNTSDENNEE